MASADFSWQALLRASEIHPMGTMASADFSWQALLHASEIHPPHVHETSPVKDILFPSYTCLIYLGHFRIAIGL